MQIFLVLRALCWWRKNKRSTHFFMLHLIFSIFLLIVYGFEKVWKYCVREYNFYIFLASNHLSNFLSRHPFPVVIFLFFQRKFEYQPESYCILCPILVKVLYLFVLFSYFLFFLSPFLSSLSLGKIVETKKIRKNSQLLRVFNLFFSGFCFCIQTPVIVSIWATKNLILINIQSSCWLFSSGSLYVLSFKMILFKTPTRSRD